MLELARLITPWCGRLTVHVVPFTANPRGAAPRLSGGAVHPAHAPVHDAHRPEGGGPAVRAGPWSPASAWARWPARPWRPCAVTGAVCDLPILRPVVGMDKEEIVRIARKIGTFETSILPYEDCCTVFTPRHPRLRPLPGEIEEAEAALDIDALVQEAYDGIERIQVNLSEA